MWLKANEKKAAKKTFNILNLVHHRQSAHTHTQSIMHKAKRQQKMCWRWTEKRIFSLANLMSLRAHIIYISLSLSSFSTSTHTQRATFYAYDHFIRISQSTADSFWNFCVKISETNLCVELLLLLFAIINNKLYLKKSANILAFGCK